MPADVAGNPLIFDGRLNP